MKKVFLFLSMVVFLFASDDIEAINRWGNPDKITSSEYETPRPQIITKFFHYKKKKVKMAFMQKNNGEWQLMGAIDTKTNKSLSKDEFLKRMQ